MVAPALISCSTRRQIAILCNQAPKHLLRTNSLQQFTPFAAKPSQAKLSHVGTVQLPNLSVIRNPRTRLRLRPRPRPSRSRVQLQSQLNALAGQGSPPSIVYRLSRRRR